MQDTDTPSYPMLPKLRLGPLDHQEPEPEPKPKPRESLPLVFGTTASVPTPPAGHGGYVSRWKRHQVALSPPQSPSQRCESPAPAPAPARGEYVPPWRRYQMEKKKELATEIPNPFASSPSQSPNPSCESPAPAHKDKEHAVDISLNQRLLPTGYVPARHRFELPLPTPSRLRCQKDRDHVAKDDDPFGLRPPRSLDQERGPSDWAEFENLSHQPWTPWRNRTAARERDTTMQAWTWPSGWTPRKVETAPAREEDSSEVTEPVASAQTEATNRPSSPENREESCQAATSPYGGRAIEVLIGHKQDHYIIPSNLARQIPCFRPGCELNGRVLLPNVNEDVGHTFMHFLYTGEYRTAKAHSATASDTAPSTTTDTKIEYNRSVLAYQAAISRGPGFEGLAQHARDCMQVLDSHIPVFDIITLGRKTMAKIDDVWFSKYLTDRIIASFEEDEAIFQEEKFFDLFGQSVEFDKFLGKVMAKAYEMKLASVRDEAHLAIVEAQSREEDIWPDWEELSGYEDEKENDSSEDREDEHCNNDQEAEPKPETEEKPEQEQSEDIISTAPPSDEQTFDENGKDSWKPNPATYESSDDVHCSKWREHFSDESCHACNMYLESLTGDVGK
ncbi:hypothetical protein BJY00DRAFT_319790 [Aspergillus carlsbadensis]|nr:hypothetical protein BJY00DRAFT_319790 [Aspergillus carlsbadensis]